MEFFDLVHTILYKYLIVPYAIWNLFYLLIIKFDDQNFIVNGNRIAAKAIRIIGVIFAINFILWMFLEVFVQGNDKVFLQGYWMAYWAQPMIWFVSTQVSRVKFVYNLWLVRLLISCFLLFQILHYTIIMTNLVSDYSEFNMEDVIFPTWYYLELLAKGLIFGLGCFTIENRNQAINMETILDDKIDDL